MLLQGRASGSGTTRHYAMSEDNHGITREQQVRDIAARLGVADFVYFAPPVSKGAAQREVAGDGLLLVGKRGAILQVKARDPVKSANDSADRARAWVVKHAAKAVAQGLGTKRELARRQAMGTPMVVFPVRAADLSPEARLKYKCLVDQDTRDWPVIVILDHPQMPEVDLGSKPGVVWFAFDDWWELQRRLRSVSATIDYISRALRDGLRVPLLQEARRYAMLRTADENAVAASGVGVPYLAHPDDFDELGTDLFHDIIDKVWPDDGIIPWRSVDEYRAIVEFLDAVPPQIQSVVGRWVLRKRSEILREQKVSSGLVSLDFRDRLVFMCSHYRYWSDVKQWLGEIALLTALRHFQALESGASEDTKTLGVAALVEERGGRVGVSYTFFMLTGSSLS